MARRDDDEPENGWLMGQLAALDEYGKTPPANWPIMDRDPFEAAALRTRQSVRPTAGRTEAPGQILGPVVHALGEPIRKGQAFLANVQRANAEMFPAQSGITEQSADYEPTKAAISAELPLVANLWGVGAASVPRASAGALGSKLAAPAIVSKPHIPPVVTKVDPAMYENALSAVKQRIPLAELDKGRVFKDKAAPVAAAEPADLPIGSTVVSLHGDRSALGELARVEGQPVGKGHVIHGGADFINTQSPNAVWASEPAVASGVQNRVGDIMDVTGKPVYGSYGPMGVRSIDFQPAAGKLALQQVRENRSKLSKEAIDLFNENMRKQWGGPTKAQPNKLADWAAVPDWPGITNTKKATEFLEEATGGVRNKFAKMLDTGAMMNAGMPNMSAIRHAFTSPEMANLPNYSYGRRIAKLSPEEAMGGLAHPAFGKNIGGESLGGFGYATPREVAFEDVVKNLQAQGRPTSQWDYFFGGRMPKTVPYQQEVTQRWIDANSAFGDRVKKMGELAAFGDFSQKGLFFTGATDKKTGAALVAAANAPNDPFYSAAQRAVENAKLSKGTPEQWLGYLRNQPGVKAEELQHVFGNLPKEGMLTKEQMQAHAAENAVQLKEVVKGDPTETARMTPDSPSFDPDRIQRANPTKYSEWQLPGGENYRETLLTLPQDRKLNEAADAAQARANVLGREAADRMREWKTFSEENPLAHPRNTEAYRAYAEAAKQRDAAMQEAAEFHKQIASKEFQSSHWSEPNVLAHVRTNIREIPPQPGGRNEPLKSLHIEEIQSDWHQKGRTAGYKTKSGDPEMDEIRNLSSGAVPDAPFKSTWADVALKRQIREASEKGYDAISWTPGEAQAKRYSLDAHLNELQYLKNSDGTYSLGGTIRGSGEGFNHPTKLTADALPGVVGKEMAEKIINGEGRHFRGNPGNMRTFEGVDLKIGGEGMRAFYDKMLVDKANAIGKKHGARVEQAELPQTQQRDLPEGMKLTHVDGGNWRVVDSDGIFISPSFRDAGQAIPWLQANGHYPKQDVHVMRITPELRAAAMKGFPLFTAGGVVAGGTMGELARQDKYGKDE